MNVPMNRLCVYMLFVALSLCACGRRTTANVPVTGDGIPMPVFDTDTAMSYIKAQTDMGPRVPGSDAHSRCGDFLVSTLRRFEPDTVIEQRVDVTAWNGDRLPLRNIMARFNQRADVKPVLLVAHWDSRPWADAETDAAKAVLPIDGANDGASGVAVLLEIARQASLHGTIMPVDILLVDGEDYGSHDDHGDDSSWCLGTQAWLACSPYGNESMPRYAILLDMVGGRDARFHREYISNRFAPGIVDMVWNAAATLGMSDRFVNEQGGAVTDDHYFLNLAGIPAIDIIESKNPETGTFNPTWHTLGDTYGNIDPAAITDTGRLVSYLTIENNQFNSGK